MCRSPFKRVIPLYMSSSSSNNAPDLNDKPSQVSRDRRDFIQDMHAQMNQLEAALSASTLQLRTYQEQTQRTLQALNDAHAQAIRELRDVQESLEEDLYAANRQISALLQRKAHLEVKVADYRDETAQMQEWRTAASIRDLVERGRRMHLNPAEVDARVLSAALERQVDMVRDLRVEVDRMRAAEQRQIRDSLRTKRPPLPQSNPDQKQKDKEFTFLPEIDQERDNEMDVLIEDFSAIVKGRPHPLGQLMLSSAKIKRNSSMRSSVAPDGLGGQARIIRTRTNDFIEL